MRGLAESRYCLTKRAAKIYSSDGYYRIVIGSLHCALISLIQFRHFCFLASSWLIYWDRAEHE